MFRRQAILVLLLAGVAYLWWQSRMPSRYAEWAEDLREDVKADLEGFFDGPHTVRWAFGSQTDTSWRVARSQDSLVRYRVESRRGDTATVKLYLDVESGAPPRKLTLYGAGKRIDIVPWGDSALFVSRGDSVTESWIPWSRDALLWEAIPALCDAWSPPDQGEAVTLVRIQVQTEVVVQLPGRLQKSADGAVVLVTSGKELVRATRDSTGLVASLCLAGSPCVERFRPPVLETHP